MNKRQKRLPCPFCGNAVNSIRGCLRTKCGCCEPSRFYCEKCGAMGPGANDNFLAETYWNTRRKKPGPEAEFKLEDIGNHKLGQWYGETSEQTR